jgi:stage V sporulation protein R
MIPTRNVPRLKYIEDRVNYYARDVYNRQLPEMRFFVLDANEFICLLEKGVYPTSPVNVWEGKNVTKRKFQVETGAASGIYYEVVQTGNPSYAYLNEDNSDTTQASVMAHVVGHCEFSELNVMGDSSFDRTEYVMHLVKKINLAKKNMGFNTYINYWNACESVAPLIAPNSQYNLENSIETDDPFAYAEPDDLENEPKKAKFFVEQSSTIEAFLNPINKDRVLEKDKEMKVKHQTIDRKGYKLKAPCQDVLGFLRNYAPTSSGEKYILDYQYTTHRHTDFVIRTQIMNEGWAMTWEKKIMMDLFNEKTVDEIIDYSKIFSGVCYPRPFFQRNPYHLGYNMWKKIENLYSKGKVSIDYVEETSLQVRDEWNKPTNMTTMEHMEHIVETCTDYEFVRRYLDDQSIEEFHLNKIPYYYLDGLMSNEDEARDLIYKWDGQYAWLNQSFVREQMLDFFTDYHRPCIYVIDDEYIDGGLLLYHRHKGRNLRKDWIPSTLKNINMIWKSPVYLLSGDSMYRAANNKMKKNVVDKVSFDQIRDRMMNGQKPVPSAGR